jgi:hypothetical protein
MGTQSEAEKRRSYAREWRKKNRDKVLLHQKRFRERHPEKVRESERRWREENREKFRKMAARKRDWRLWLREPVGLAGVAASLRWSGLHWEQEEERAREYAQDSRDEELAALAEIWFPGSTV